MRGCWRFILYLRKLVAVPFFFCLAVPCALAFGKKLELGFFARDGEGVKMGDLWRFILWV